MNDENLIKKTVRIVGRNVLAKACGKSPQAIRKWEAAGRLPRTEWTGETQYAEIFENITNGVVTQQELVPIPKFFKEQLRVLA